MNKKANLRSALPVLRSPARQDVGGYVHLKMANFFMEDTSALLHGRPNWLPTARSLILYLLTLGMPRTNVPLVQEFLETSDGPKKESRL